MVPSVCGAGPSGTIVAETRLDDHGGAFLGTACGCPTRAATGSWELPVVKAAFDARVRSGVSDVSVDLCGIARRLVLANVR
jgi:hypothetical protein